MSRRGRASDAPRDAQKRPPARARAPQTKDATRRDATRRDARRARAPKRSGGGEMLKCASEPCGGGQEQARERSAAVDVVGGAEPAPEPEPERDPAPAAAHDGRRERQEEHDGASKDLKRAGTASAPAEAGTDTYPLESLTQEEVAQRGEAQSRQEPHREQDEGQEGPEGTYLKGEADEPDAPTNAPAAPELPPLTLKLPETAVMGSPRTPADAEMSLMGLESCTWLARVKHASLGLHGCRGAAVYLGVAPRLRAFVVAADFSPSESLMTRERSRSKVLSAISRTGGLVFGSPFEAPAPPTSGFVSPTKRAASSGKEAQSLREDAAAMRNCSGEGSKSAGGVRRRRRNTSGGDKLDSGGADASAAGVTTTADGEGQSGWASPRAFVSKLLRAHDVDAERQCVVALEVPFDSVAGFDYSNPLCLDGRVALEARWVDKRCFDDGRALVEDYQNRAAAALSALSSPGATTPTRRGSWSLPLGLSPGRAPVSDATGCESGKPVACTYKNVTIVCNFLNWQTKGVADVLEDAIRNNQRLLKLYETGIPAWAIFAGSHGFFYRTWLRLYLGRLLVFLSFLSLALGLVDLWHHLPQAREHVDAALDAASATAPARVATRALAALAAAPAVASARVWLSLVVRVIVFPMWLVRQLVVAAASLLVAVLRPAVVYTFGIVSAYCSLLRLTFVWAHTALSLVVVPLRFLLRLVLGSQPVPAAASSEMPDLALLWRSIFSKVWRGVNAIKNVLMLLGKMMAAHRISLLADLLRVWEDVRQAGRARLLAMPIRLQMQIRRRAGGAAAAEKDA